MNHRPLIPRLLGITVLVLGLGRGVFLFGEWCEALLMSRRLQHRLELVYHDHLAGMERHPILLDDPPEGVSAAEHQGAAPLTIERSRKSETLGRFKAAVRYPLYALRMELVSWHGISSKALLGCLDVSTGEVAVQPSVTDPVPALCSPVSAAFSPPPGEGDGGNAAVRD
jgi:hypothetical protein